MKKKTRKNSKGLEVEYLPSTKSPDDEQGYRDFLEFVYLLIEEKMEQDQKDLNNGKLLCHYCKKPIMGNDDFFRYEKQHCCNDCIQKFLKDSKKSST